MEQARQGSLNHSGYILPTDTKKYSESELSKLDDHTLFLARNEIYARHGRKFVSQELQTYFAQKSWYKPSVEPGDFPTPSALTPTPCSTSRRAAAPST